MRGKYVSPSHFPCENVSGRTVKTRIIRELVNVTQKERTYTASFLFVFSLLPIIRNSSPIKFFVNPDDLFSPLKRVHMAYD